MMYVKLNGKDRKNVRSFKEASKAVIKYIDDRCMGASDMSANFGKIYKDDKFVARVSYNGRVWDKNDYEIAI